MDARERAKHAREEFWDLLWGDLLSEMPEGEVAKVDAVIAYAVRAAESEALDRAAEECLSQSCCPDAHGPCSNAMCEMAHDLAQRIRSLKTKETP